MRWLLGDGPISRGLIAWAVGPSAPGIGLIYDVTVIDVTTMIEAG